MCCDINNVQSYKQCAITKNNVLPRGGLKFFLVDIVKFKKLCHKQNNLNVI